MKYLQNKPMQKKAQNYQSAPLDLLANWTNWLSIERYWEQNKCQKKNLFTQITGELLIKEKIFLFQKKVNENNNMSQTMNVIRILWSMGKEYFFNRWIWLKRHFTFLQITLWLIYVLLASVCLFQILLVIRYYWSLSTMLSLINEPPNSTKFPGITICAPTIFTPQKLAGKIQSNEICSWKSKNKTKIK